MLLAALAAQLSMPVPERGHLWDYFEPDDVPVEIIGVGYGRRVDVRVTVGPEGRIRNCQTEFSSEVPKLDTYTCDLIIRRARFRPAIWPDGSPAYGVVRTGIGWSVNADMPPAPGDIQLSVAQLPRGVRSPAFARLMFAVDEAGRLSSCTEQVPRNRQPDKLTPALLKVACEQLLANFKAIPAKDDDGKPVRSVQNATVRFSVERRK